MASDPLHHALIFDWNSDSGLEHAPNSVEILDETLRDGLQSPAVRFPKLEEKQQAIGLMEGVGVGWVNLGFLAVSQQIFDDCLVLCREITAQKWAIQPVCAGRTLVSDVQPMVELAQRSGLAVEASVFIGVSGVRQKSEGWDLDWIKRQSQAAITLAVKQGLPVTFVTEDTTRSHPEVLRELFMLAIGEGASRLCLCDTVGIATPAGVQRLVQFSREVIENQKAPVQLDWHGHNDRGLGLCNALAAVEAGVHRVHGTALGVGERVGNTPMELLLVNLWLNGRRTLNPEHLCAYVDSLSSMLRCPLSEDYPVFGRNAFRTASGLHAAAILKAQGKDSTLAERVYSFAPPGWLGRANEISVGPLSGSATIAFWLKKSGRVATPQAVAALLTEVRKTDHTLNEAELELLARTCRIP